MQAMSARNDPSPKTKTGTRIKKIYSEECSVMHIDPRQAFVVRNRSHKLKHKFK